MAFNISRIFKGRSADSVVTDNQHPDDEATDSTHDRYANPEANLAHPVPGGSTENIIILDNDGETEVARMAGHPTGDGIMPFVEQEPVVSDQPGGQSGLIAKWEGPDIDAAKNEILYNGHAGLGADGVTDGTSNTVLHGEAAKGIVDAADYTVWRSDGTGGEPGQEQAMQDVFVTELRPPDPQVSVFGVGGGVDDTQRSAPGGTGVHDIHPNQGNAEGIVQHNATDWDFAVGQADDHAGDNARHTSAFDLSVAGRQPDAEGLHEPGKIEYPNLVQGGEDGTASEAPFDRGYLPPAIAPVETAIPAFQAGINDQTPADWNERSAAPGRFAPQPLGLQPDHGGLDTNDETPEFGDAATARTGEPSGIYANNIGGGLLGATADHPLADDVALRAGGGVLSAHTSPLDISVFGAVGGDGPGTPQTNELDKSTPILAHNPGGPSGLIGEITFPKVDANPSTGDQSTSHAFGPQDPPAANAVEYGLITAAVGDGSGSVSDNANRTMGPGQDHPAGFHIEVDGASGGYLSSVTAEQPAALDSGFTISDDLVNEGATDTAVHPSGEESLKTEWITSIAANSDALIQKFEGEDGETARAMAPDHQGQGFMQDGELYPRGIEGAAGPLKFDGVGGEAGQYDEGDTATHERSSNFDVQDIIAKHPPAGYTATDDLWKFRDGDGATAQFNPKEIGIDRAGFVTEIELPQAQDGSGTDNANRTMGPGHQAEVSMMQDGELYPRGLKFDTEVTDFKSTSGMDSETEVVERVQAPHQPEAAGILPFMEGDNALDYREGGVNDTTHQLVDGDSHQGEGFFSLPEKDDEVLVGFSALDADADAPTTLVDIHTQGTEIHSDLVTQHVDIPHHFDPAHHDVPGDHAHGHESLIDHLPDINL